jgi:DNA polymerase III subunit delta
LERLIDGEMRAAGLSLKPEARDLLVTLLGGDRAGSRSEIRKLVLYAHGRAEIGVNDVTAVVSDASDLALDELVDTAFAGRTSELDPLLSKVREAGTPIGSIFFAAQRQLAQLHKWRIAMEAGELSSVDRLQPPVHFSRKELVGAALQRWSAARLAGAMTELAEAVLVSRKTSSVAQAVAERALLSISRRASAGAARNLRSPERV